MIFSLIISILILTNCSTSKLDRFPAAPTNPEAYEVRNGSGINTLPEGSILEGSSSYGGIQPDYIIDRNHPDIRTLIKTLKKSTESVEDFWKKVQMAIDLVSEETLVKGDYDDPDYLALVKRYREAGVDIPFSEYISCRAGVCRENAILMHILLDEIGIENFHLYAKVQQGAPFTEPENHAFLAVRHNDELWTVDAYNVNFNGFLLTDLMKKDGGEDSPHLAPIAEEYFSFRRILAINDFPKIWIPTSITQSCSNIIKSLF